MAAMTSFHNEKCWHLASAQADGGRCCICSPLSILATVPDPHYIRTCFKA